MIDIFENFCFEPNGATSLVDALCSFIKEEIAYGRIKGGEKFPTIHAISKATGLSFGQARSVTERLAREGYVRSRPRAGTIVLSRGKNLLRGRVLVAYPDIDICRYYPTQLFGTLNRMLTAENYAVSVVTFPFEKSGCVAQLRSELNRQTDLVIVMRATPAVQKCLAESGVKCIFAYGSQPMKGAGCHCVDFNLTEALTMFAAHCQKADVKHVVQVGFEKSEVVDASPALAEMGIESSWLTISRPMGGRGCFEGIESCAFETFANMPRNDIPELLLFWNAFAAQGALMALLNRGIRIPEDVKVVSFSETGFGPVYIKPITRFESNPISAGEMIADFALAVLAKARVLRPPQIKPQYVCGETFPL